ncbi:MAG: threonine synthase [Ignavibacteria bacterium]|nr:threonine synthase [Ignavibacteria bacterium]
MKYFSSNSHEKYYSFHEAVTLGLAPDGGLFLPELFPVFPGSIDDLRQMDFHDRIYSLLYPFVEDLIPPDIFGEIVKSVFNFEICTREYSSDYSVLELYHGPTLAFKDFGARFLAAIISYFSRADHKDSTILVATSGDTGSAVASAFYLLPGTKVVILYPSGKVSINQEKQLTTFGENIIALEINGSFDDCQKLVKTAFLDTGLTQQFSLTSANSINIARLLPQAVYYIESYLASSLIYEDIEFVVPSGNLGNLCAGLIAQRILNMPVHFTSALNSNKMFEDYLATGIKTIRPGIETLSNAMDVGNPSNLERLITIFGGPDAIKKNVRAMHFDDDQTIKGIKHFYSEFTGIICPHTAVGYLAASMNKLNGRPEHQIILSTAHPAKFTETINRALGFYPEMPERLQKVLEKNKFSIVCDKDYQEFRRVITNVLASNS